MDANGIVPFKRMETGLVFSTRTLIEIVLFVTTETAPAFLTKMETIAVSLQVREHDSPHYKHRITSALLVAKECNHLNPVQLQDNFMCTGWVSCIM
jgi:hypothetical protein